MVAIPYGAAAYKRDNGNLPELRLKNMFLEKAPTADNGAVLLSRKGLSEYASVGSGPIAGVFSEQGVFDGDVFCVSGGILYRGSTSLGAIAGTGPVSFAAYRNEMAITAGSTLYRYDATNGLDAVAFPDNAPVRKVIFHDGLFLAARGTPTEGTEQWYFSATLDADDWDALDFASAERRPDDLYDILTLNDTLWLFGASTIEPWANTGEAALPYARFEQRIFSKGIYGTGCAVEIDNTLAWVGNDGIVYRLGEIPERISDHGIEERIEDSATVSAFAFVFEGHSFFCVRLDASTFAYDVATGQWCEFATYGHGNFRGRCASTSGQAVIFGDDTDGTLWTFGGYADGTDPLERLFTAAFPIKAGTVTVDNLQIEANVGWTELLAGQGSDPVAELRSSRDGGATWSNWRTAKLGQQGEYRTKTQWRRCGMFDAPGAMFECRVTDPVGFRVSYVGVNEQGGGRSR